MGVEIMALPAWKRHQPVAPAFQNLGGQNRKPRKLKIKDAMKLLAEEEAPLSWSTRRAETKCHRRG